MAKSDEKSAPTPKEAEAALRDAQAELHAAAERAAEAGQGLMAAKMANVPPMIVEVLPNQVVSHDGKSYYGADYPLAPEGHEGGDTLSLDGPTAIALMQAGHVMVKGAA